MKSVRASAFDPKKAIIYFDLVFSEDNLNEDRDSNPEEYEKFLKLGNGDLTKASLKAENMALHEAKTILKVNSIGNEGHGSGDELVCKISVNSLKDAKAIFDIVKRKHGGGDDVVYLNAPYMEMRGFLLFPEGINKPSYSLSGSGNSDVEEFFDEVQGSVKASLTFRNKKAIIAALITAKRLDLANEVAKVKADKDKPKGTKDNPWNNATRAEEGPTKPTKPTEPVKPSKPSEPVKPTKKTEPTKPTKPGTAEANPFRRGEATSAPEKSYQAVERLQSQSGPGKGPTGKPKTPGSKSGPTPGKKVATKSPKL